MAPTRSKRQSARRLGLTYCKASSLVIRRQRHGRGFTYLDDNGKRVSTRSVLQRLKALAIPPAWCEVHIHVDATAHIQAIGIDEAGRRQYIYHERWQEYREERKAERLAEFAEALPSVRAGVKKDLRATAGEKRLALAAAVALIDASVIRVGSEEHLARTGSRGAVTLRQSNVRVTGKSVHLHFKGKGGKVYETTIEDARLAKAIARLKELPCRRLFSYRSGGGAWAHIRAADLNTYLRELSAHRISGKDFRTFFATALAGDMLAELEPSENERKRNGQIVAVAREVAEVLGNTGTIARKSYIHDVVIDKFNDGTLSDDWRRSGRRAAGLEAHESALVRLLR